jgi:hypothetical protein
VGNRAQIRLCRFPSRRMKNLVSIWRSPLKSL